MAGVLLYSRDPGATNQMILFAEELASPAPGPLADLFAFLGLKPGESEALVYAKAGGLKQWRAAGREVGDWQALVGEPGDRLARFGEILGELAPAAVVTGNDDVDDGDFKLLWIAARARGIPTATLVDSAQNTRVRFLDAAGDPLFPDRVVAQHAETAEALRGLGLEAERIHFVGDLHLARVARIAARVPAERRRELRRDWGCDGDELVVVFASENTAEMAEAGRPAEWDEVALLDALARHLGEGLPLGGVGTSGRSPRLVVRPHPRERAGKYADVLARAPLPMTTSTAGTPVEVMAACDVVTGMESMFLFEAEHIGKPTFALTRASRFPYVVDLGGDPAGEVR